MPMRCFTGQNALPIAKRSLVPLMRNYLPNRQTSARYDELPLLYVPRYIPRCRSMQMIAGPLYRIVQNWHQHCGESITDQPRRRSQTFLVAVAAMAQDLTRFQR